MEVAKGMGVWVGHGEKTEEQVAASDQWPGPLWEGRQEVKEQELQAHTTHHHRPCSNAQSKAREVKEMRRGTPLLPAF